VIRLCFTDLRYLEDVFPDSVMSPFTASLTILPLSLLFCEGGASYDFLHCVVVVAGTSRGDEMKVLAKEDGGIMRLWCRDTENRGT